MNKVTFSMGKTQAVRKRPDLLLKYVFKRRKVDGGICTWSLEEHGEKEWKTAGKKERKYLCFTPNISLNLF